MKVHRPLISYIFRACLSCFGNGRKKADLEGSPRGLQKAWIVKIILAQFSLIRAETRNSVSTADSEVHTSVFASFLGVSILFCNASSA